MTIEHFVKDERLEYKQVEGKEREKYNYIIININILNYYYYYIRVLSDTSTASFEEGFMHGRGFTTILSNSI
jgi:hypothetical protein